MRFIAALLGLVILGLSIFVGAIFVAAIVGMAIIGAIIIAVRAWFLSRKMEAYARDHGDLEGEFTVIKKDGSPRDHKPLD